MTAAVTDLLTRDSLKVARIEGYTEPYTVEDIRALSARFETVPLKSAYRRGGIEVELHPAGHIPGATMFLYRGDKDVLFTGDLSGLPTRLVGPAVPAECDVLVMESTYAGREHPERKETERRLRDRIEEVLEDGGRVLVPAFAVGRAQEILLALAQSGFEVWLDGMARKVNDIYRAAPEALRDAKRFHRAVDGAHIVQHSSERRHALREAEVIVTTGGMLDGGPVLFYLAEMYRDSRHAIFLTRLPGRWLERPPAPRSGHRHHRRGDRAPRLPRRGVRLLLARGHSELVALARATKAYRILLMHGDRRAELARSLVEFAEVSMPENGERLAL